MSNENPIFSNSERRAHHKALSGEIRVTNSNRLRKIYAQDLYIYGFENLQKTKYFLRQVAGLIQRSYEDGTPPKSIKMLKKYAGSLFRSIQKSRELAIMYITHDIATTKYFSD